MWSIKGNRAHRDKEQLVKYYVYRYVGPVLLYSQPKQDWRYNYKYSSLEVAVRFIVWRME